MTDLLSPGKRPACRTLNLVVAFLLIFLPLVATAKPPTIEAEFLQAIKVRDIDTIKKVLSDLHQSGNPVVNDSLYLIAAIEQGDSNLLAVMLDNHSNPNSHRADGRTPLHHAALQGDEQMVKLLLSRGAAINAVDKSGAGVLHFAARGAKADQASMRRMVQITRLLIQSGANIHAVTRTEGVTPLQACVSADMLGGIVNPLLAEYLLASGSDPNTATKCCGWTPLHIVVFSGNLPLTKLLLDYGANTEAKSFDNLTPLEVAEKFGQIECAKALSAHKSDRQP